MPAKISPLDRVTDFFLNGDPAETRAAFKVVQSIMRARFREQKPARRPRMSRKQQADEPTTGGEA